MSGTEQNELKPTTIEDSHEIIENNKVVSFHYRLAEVDGDGQVGPWLEDSFGRSPLLYLHGFHNVVVGLEKALAGKKVGDQISITLQPEDAYGQRFPNALQRVPIKHIRVPGDSKKLGPGSVVTVNTDRGPKRVLVVKAGKFNADVDMNHPLAGKILHYEIEVISLRNADSNELAHGHVHGPGGHH